MRWREYHSRRREHLRLHAQRRFLAAAFAVLAGLAPGACSSPSHDHKIVVVVPPAGLSPDLRPVAATTPTSLVSPNTPSAWDVVAGETVTDTVRRWARLAGYTPVPHFSAPETWHVIVNEEFSGSFEQALQWLSDGFSRHDRKPLIELHANRTLDLLSMPGDGTAGREIN